MSSLVRYGPAIVKSRPRRWLEGIRSIWLGEKHLKDPELVKYLDGGNRTNAGIRVNEQNAFTFSAVFDAVNQISSDIGKLPLNLRKRRPSGGSDPYVDSPVYRLLKSEPNPEMGSMVFRRTLTAHALTWHGGFAEIERDGLGRPAALWPLNPAKVRPDRQQRGLVYLVKNEDGTEVMLDPQNVLHLTGLGFDPHVGYPVIQYSRQAIGLALAAEQFGSSFFSNGATFGGILTSDLNLNDEEIERVKALLETRHQGTDLAFRLAFIMGGFKYQKAGVDPQNAQMNELRSKQVEEVARFFNMPVHKLKDLDRATNNNIEQQDLEYYKGCLLNWITLWEEECNRKLINKAEFKQQFVKHNANAFLRGDTVSRTAFYSAMLDRGVYNADEVLELEDMNPQPDGQGKLYLVQGAMVPKDRLAKMVDAKIEASAQPKNPPQAPMPEPPPNDPNAGRMLQELIARTERAEAAVAGATAKAEAERDARVAAEASVTVTKEEREAAQTREQAAIAQVTLAQIALAEAQRNQAVATEQAEAEREARVTAEAAAATATSERDQAVAMIEQADEEARSAAQAAEAAAEALKTAQAELTSQARLAAERARSELTAAVEARAKAEADLAIKAEAEQAAMAARESALAEADALRSSAAELTAQLDEAAKSAESFKAQLASIQDKRNESETRANALQNARTEAEEALKAAKRAESDACGIVIAAHRSLIAHVMRGAIERETDRARRHQQTPDKLRSWMETWYDSHAELMTAALLPAVTVHLAWIRSPENPGDVVRQLVAAHVAESKRQLEAVLDGDAGDLARSLAQLLTRWENERVSVLADVLMQKEIEYVQKRAA